MKTECSREKIEFTGHGRRGVVGRFDGGAISSDGGALLLREANNSTRVIEQAAACFTDYRDPRRTEHTVRELLAQRVYGLALGYEDLNDHNRLRHDPLMAVLAGKPDPTGMSRRREADKGRPLAGAATLNRLELTGADASAAERYKKISLDAEAAMLLFARLFVEGREEPSQIVLDLDATDAPTHGKQEGRFFHGYYGHYCYLPLYIFCGETLLWAELRRANIDAAAGSVEALEKIVGAIRERWPEVRIVVRADSGFCRDALMSWCEANGVDFVLGLARNSRLTRKMARAMKTARRRYGKSGQAERQYRHIAYRTRKSWGRSRRVVGKAEYIPGKENHRFVVASLSAEEVSPKELYEDWYCARGDMENRIKEQQLDLFADRTSTATLRGNQIRLWLSSLAYTLVQLLRERGLTGTKCAKAQCGTIRENLFKIGAQVSVTARKVWVRYSEAYPYIEIFRQTLRNLRAASP